MDITPLLPAGRQVVEAYGDGGFRVSGEDYRGSVLVFPEVTLAWPVAAIGELSAASLAPVTARDAAIDLLLVGCGARMALIDPAVRGEVRADGVVIEAMDTGAACRTYNVLMAEGRAVAAALIAVD